MNAKKTISLLFCLCLLLPTYAQDTNTHPWKKRRVAYFGDSITDPKNDGSTKKYWNFLEEWLGIEPLVYGKSGRQWDDIPRQAELLQKEHGNQFDAIIIFIGTNDFNKGIPIGTWYDEGIEQVKVATGTVQGTFARRMRTPAMNDNTYCGRINKALSTIKKMYPTKQVVLLTPIHRALFDRSETNLQPDERYENSCGEFFDAYVECVREAGKVWAMPVIDTYALSGLFPVMEEGAIYFHDADKDRLHPNDAGQRRIASTLLYQLATLPCVFE